jgi:serine/threonine-protein kinase
MTDLFVSYKAEDRSRVAPLVQALQADGYSVWWDAEIGGGEEWRDAICQHLDAAQRVIVVWSKKSVGPHGNFVRDEATRALKRRAYLPVRIDRVDPPLGFGEMQSLDLVGWKGDRESRKYQALLAALRNEPATPAAAPRKGIDRRTVIGGTAAAAAAAVGGWALLRPTSAKADSIAVLPFANLSGDPDQDYFSDGIAEELRSALARIAGLKVVGRISSEAVRDEDAKEAARKLSVANILTGSVRRSPGLIRVNAQLLDGRNGIERWSEIYDRAAGDAIDVQADIATKVAEALSFSLGGDAAGPGAGGTRNAEAHDVYLKGVAVRRMGHDKDLLEDSIANFDRAIALDPGFSDAYAQKASALADLTGVFASNASEFSTGFAEAAKAARRAIELAPGSAMARVALAETLAGILKLREADIEYRQAARAGFNDPLVMTRYSLFLSQTGRVTEGLQVAERAIAFDPLNPRPYAMKGAALFAMKRYEEAIPAFERVLSIAKIPPVLALTRIGECHMLMGNLAKAREALGRIPADDLFRLATEAILAARSGDRAASNASLEKLRRLSGETAVYQEAEILAQQKDVESAIAALERAYELRDPGLQSLPTDTYLDPLRADQRFKSLATKLGFPL